MKENFDNNKHSDTYLKEKSSTGRWIELFLLEYSI